MNKLLFSLLLLLAANRLFAQTDLSFDIRYPLKVSASSGQEKHQFAEFQNGKMILYRFESDSVFGSKQYIRLWCIDQQGNKQWDHIFFIGESDTIWLSASLASYNNEAFLAYTHIDESTKSSLSLLHISAAGTILSSNKVNIPNIRQVRNARSLIQNQELILAFDILDMDSIHSLAFGKIPLSNFSASTWFHTDELRKCTELYFDENNVSRLIAIKNDRAVDLSLDQSGTYQAIEFPVEFIPENALKFNNSTYYVGFLWDSSSVYLNTVLHKLEDNQSSGWMKRLNASGPSYHGSTVSGIMESQGKILIEGYGSVPHPTTFVSVFEENGTLLKTELFNTFHSFNYNYGELFKHSSGSLFFAELGGIWTGTQFTTVVTRIDTLNFNACNSEAYTYPYTDSLIQHTITSIQFSPETYTFSPIAIANVSDSFPDEILCHPNLSLNEAQELFVEVYPNPFTENFVLRSERIHELIIHCFDLMGKEIPVDQLLLDDQQIRLTPPHGFSGALFCRVQTADGTTQTVLMQQMK